MTYTAAAELLKERVILVTGAGNGIGAAVAKSYAQHGATVILLDKKIPSLEQVYDDIIAAGHSTPAIYPLDLKGASIPDYDELATKVHDNFGRLDGLVHCAASLGQLAPVQHQDPKIWLETVHINLTAAYLLTRSCLPLMQKFDKASIIFTTDNHKNTAYWAGYGISKAGIEALSKQLADELESDGRIRVNCIDPGTVKTELHTHAFPAIDPTHLPAPEDIVSSYLYLMGEDSLTINGELITAQ
ncbi:MAG: YciK family oxidoreductase [Gammaproteobacteria bacterium]|nr:MAG: YciK family oxidoreductase [Gammaproteobacteria bacterium]